MRLRRLMLSIALASAVAGAHAASGVLTDFTYQTGSPRAPEQEKVVFELADLSFRLLPETQSLEGDAKLTFRATAPIERLVVELDRNFDVSVVELDGQPLPRSAWRNPEGRMTVDLPRTLAAGESTVLRIAYAGKPHVAERAPWDGGFVWAKAPTGEPWIATAIQGSGCDLFWPCIDHSLGEPLQVDQHVTVPAPLVAAGNGIAMGMDEHTDAGGDAWRTYHWRAKNPNTYAIALNVGPYALMQGTYESRYGNTIPLRFWHLRGNEAKAKGLFAEFSTMLDFFEEKIGPYPFADEKMGVVETPHLGMEHQTINAYGNEYKLDGRGFDWLLHHELSHEWFGNQLTNRNADDMWLHEGFGTYMQPLYARWRNGERFMQAYLLEQRRDLINKFPVVSGEEKSEDEVYQGETGPGLDIYNKGSLIAHSLRMLIGDEAFFRSVTRLVYGTATPRPGEFRPRNGTTDELLAIVNEEAGRDLTWFFRGYLYQAALPDLRQTRADGELALEWVTGDGGVFPMPVEVEVDGVRQTVAMTGGRGRIAAPAGAHVLIDPDNKVLRRLEFIEAWKAAGGAG